MVSESIAGQVVILTRDGLVTHVSLVLVAMFGPRMVVSTLATGKIIRRMDLASIFTLIKVSTSVTITTIDQMV